MRIYVACLASYNAGKQHGTWIDIEGKDADNIKTEIDAMLRESPCPNTTCDCPECDGDGCADCQETGKVPTAEEWAIHDYDDLPDVGEQPDLEFLARYAEAYEEHEEVFKVWWENERNEDFDVSDFEEQYQGTFRSLADYAEDWMDSTGGLNEIPENLRSYFDFEAWGRDCEMGGDIWTREGGEGIYVFLNH
jgi:antirestriction protein